MGFEKLVFLAPISLAFLFMRFTKPLMLPAIFSAITLAASFADASINICKRSFKYICSPGCIPTLEPPSPIDFTAKLLAVQGFEKSPSSMASIAVIILDTLAGCNFVSAFFSKITLSEFASINM